MDSILDTIKKLLGIDPSYTPFDADIIIHINSVFNILQQLGVGPAFSIDDNSTTWDEYTTNADVSMLKTYMYLKVKMIFDPPLSSVSASAYNETIKELEWRLNVAVDPGKEE